MILPFAALALVAVLPVLASPIQKRFTGVRLRAGRTNTCLSLSQQASPKSGSNLILDDCAGPSVSLWDISPGSGSVVLANLRGDDESVLALDAGIPLANNTRAKLWQSFPGAPQQT
jgi:hypothetical protein